MLRRIPRTFAEDRESRELGIGTVLSTTAQHVVVDVDEATWADVLSDARHYADMHGSWYDGDWGLVASAKALLRWERTGKSVVKRVRR